MIIIPGLGVTKTEFRGMFETGEAVYDTSRMSLGTTRQKDQGVDENSASWEDLCFNIIFFVCIQSFLL